MADDTREKEDLSKEGLTVHPEHKPFSGGQWEGAKHDLSKGPQNANLMAGGTQNTAGGKIPEVSVGGAFEGGLKLQDFTDLPKRPCVRDAFMTGIGAGFALGGARAIFGATIFSACTWAVFSTCAGSSVMYQYCLYRRQAERDGMMRAVEILNKNQLEKKAREEAKARQKEERRKMKEEELNSQYAKLRESNDGGTGKPWWKVW
ncbi:hypothetical protein LTR37_017137 [Vermiconidia calcicola]|uniref:Uncharacterized protein n=1 Tax=Vermiconidia calcicola TaxID=1690605 RepID=A0ACC3MKS2_9PEZI|nr:hypothetical protein LTR37_017137 [Vermiconidia calcicola]